MTYGMDNGRELSSVEVGQLKQKGRVEIQCDCGAVLYVWSDRNECLCHRARCLTCRHAASFALTAKGKPRLFRFNDTYEEWEVARKQVYTLDSVCLLQGKDGAL